MLHIENKEDKHQNISCILCEIIPQELLSVLSLKGLKTLEIIFSTDEQIESLSKYKKLARSSHAYRYSALFIGSGEFLEKKTSPLEYATKSSIAADFCINILKVIDPKNLNQNDMHLAIRALSRALAHKFVHDHKLNPQKIIVELFGKYLAHLQLKDIADNKKESIYNYCLNFIIHDGLTLNVFLAEILPFLYKKTDGTTIRWENGHFPYLGELFQIEIRTAITQINTQAICQKNLLELFPEKNLSMLNAKSYDFLVRCFPAADLTSLIENLLLAKKSTNQTCYSKLLLEFLDKLIDKTDVKTRSIVNADFCLYLFNGIDFKIFSQRELALSTSFFSKAILYTSVQDTSDSPLTLLSSETKLLLDTFRIIVSILMAQELLDDYKMEICRNYFDFIFGAYCHYIKRAKKSKKKHRMHLETETFEKIFSDFLKNLPSFYKPEFFKQMEFACKEIDEEYSRRIKAAVLGEKAMAAKREMIIKELLEEDRKEKEKEIKQRQIQHKKELKIKPRPSKTFKQKTQTVKPMVANKTTSNPASCTKKKSVAKEVKIQSSDFANTKESSDDSTPWTTRAKKNKKPKAKGTTLNSSLANIQIPPCTPLATPPLPFFEANPHKPPSSTETSQLTPAISKLTWAEVAKLYTKTCSATTHENRTVSSDTSDAARSTVSSLKTTTAADSKFTNASPSFWYVKEVTTTTSTSNCRVKIFRREAPLSAGLTSHTEPSNFTQNFEIPEPGDEVKSSGSVDQTELTSSTSSSSLLSLSTSECSEADDLPKEAAKKKLSFAEVFFLQDPELSPYEACTTFKKMIANCLKQQWYKKGLELFENKLYKIARECMSIEVIQYFENINHTFFRELNTEKTYSRMGIDPGSHYAIYPDGFFKLCFTPEECLKKLCDIGIYKVFNINPDINFTLGLTRDPILAKWIGYRISEAITIGEPIKDIIITAAIIIQSTDSGIKEENPISTLVRNQVRVNEKKISLSLSRIGNILGYIEEYTLKVNETKRILLLNA